MCIFYRGHNKKYQNIKIQKINLRTCEWYTTEYRWPLICLFRWASVTFYFAPSKSRRATFNWTSHLFLMKGKGTSVSKNPKRRRKLPSMATQGGQNWPTLDTQRASPHPPVIPKKKSYIRGFPRWVFRVCFPSGVGPFGRAWWTAPCR